MQITMLPTSTYAKLVDFVMVQYKTIPSELGAELIERLEDDTVREMSQELFDFLFEQHVVQMPYGTATAKTDDPTEWLAVHLEGLTGVFMEIA